MRSDFSSNLSFSKKVSKIILNPLFMGRSVPFVFYWLHRDSGFEDGNETGR